LTGFAPHIFGKPSSKAGVHHSPRRATCHRHPARCGCLPKRQPRRRRQEASPFARKGERVFL